MGSYNVACSVSGLSIGGGTTTYFIPLYPNRFTIKKGKHILQPETSLIYSDCIYYPATLPIEGKYDTYGRIENIKPTQITKDIENYFGITIKQFIDCVSIDRSPFDSYGGIYHAYSINKNADIYGELTPERLRNIGLTINQKTKQWTHKSSNDHYVIFDFIEDQQNYGALIPAFLLYNTNGELVRKYRGSSAPKDLQNDWHFLTGYYLNISDDNQKKVYELTNMAGMFVHGQIYDYMKTIHPHFYGSSLEQRYNKMLSKVTEVNKQTDKTMQFLIEMDLSDFSDDFLRHFHDWNQFEKIHIDSIRADKLKEDCFNFIRFTRELYSVNRFFFPAMNGEQYGNLEASLRLIEKSKYIIECETNEMQEDGLYDESEET